MSAYMLVIAEIDNMEEFRDYAVAAADLIGKFGGEYIVRGAKDAVTLEGDWPEEKKVVVSKWPQWRPRKNFGILPNMLKPKN